MFPQTLKIKPQPDFGRLEKVLRRQGIPDRVPFCELFSNIEFEVLKTIGQTAGPAPETTDPQYMEWSLRQRINHAYHLGYDYINVGSNNFSFPIKANPSTITKEGERAYYLGSSHTIANREDFEKYDWPVMSKIDYSPLEQVSKILPEGMKVMSGGPGGVLENVMWLLGYEGISYLLYDDEPLVQDMFNAVGTRMLEYFSTAASFDVIGALILGDDMGFKTQTMLSPDVFRKYVFPWHKKVVDAVHRHNKPIVLHSCGNLKEVIEDVIGCGWDARHSFEDGIEPVWEAKKTHGDRIAHIGGFDVDKICRMTEKEVRQHTRFLIEKCAPGGGWALGTGNSVASYVPVNNLLAMLEEGYLAGKY